MSQRVKFHFSNMLESVKNYKSVLKTIYINTNILHFFSSIEVTSILSICLDSPVIANVCTNVAYQLGKNFFKCTYVLGILAV